MRTIKIFVIVFITLLTTSCGEWLDVKSKSEVEIDDIFTTEEGYYQSLTGIYITMGDSKLYGGNLTLSTLEPLSGQYSVSTNNIDRTAWKEYKYAEKNSRTLIDGIWLQMYNSIVNSNILIERLRGNTPAFDAGVKEILLGEALALRAYMYFDLIRMFNESYMHDKDSKNVPLKNDFGIITGKRLTTTELMGKLMTDLAEARTLLKANDPIVAAKSYTDPYVKYNRMRRMNYYAVQALSARMSLFLNDYTNAYNYAKEVIESNKFTFITRDQIVQKDIYGVEQTADRECTPELVFALDCDNITLTSRKGYEVLSEDFLVDASLTCYSSLDIRREWHYKNPSANNKVQMIKYRRPSSQDEAAKYKKATVPMLKLGEMYLIAEECLANQASLDGVRLSYINKLKAEREASPMATESTFNQELTHEYICEMRGEGELFYYYKRLAMTRIDNGSYNGNTKEIKRENYTFPRPQSEDDFGN